MQDLFKGQINTDDCMNKILAYSNSIPEIGK